MNTTHKSNTQGVRSNPREKAVPELAPERIAGYMAMAEPLLSMWEVSDFHDPMGESDFRELVYRLVPHKPGFLQLANWFLVQHGPINLGRSKVTGRSIMADEGQRLAWKKFVRVNAEERMPILSSHTYRFHDDDLQDSDRQKHLDALVRGEQYLFEYRAVSASVGVNCSIQVSVSKREYTS